MPVHFHNPFLCMTRFAVQTDTVNQSSTSAAYAEGRVDGEKLNT